MSHAKVFSPRLDHRLAFAEKMSHDLTMGVHVQAVSAAEEALESADILITGIDSVAPILETTHRREIVPYKLHGNRHYGCRHRSPSLRTMTRSPTDTKNITTRFDQTVNPCPIT